MVSHWCQIHQILDGYSLPTHRPYRASLGIEMALEEIERNRGLLYDKDVADTCLQLFRSGKFQFETE